MGLVERAVPGSRGSFGLRRVRHRSLFAGTSTGLNLVGALAVARELGPGKGVATAAVDTGLKYLAGDLYKYAGGVSEAYCDFTSNRR